MMRSGKSGFTLVEVMAAFFIVVVTIFAALDLFVQSKRYQSRAWDVAASSFAAAAILEQIKRTPYEQVVSMPKTAHPEYQSLYYSVEVSPAAFYDMKTVTVSVFYAFDGEEKNVSLSMEKFNR